MAQLQPQQAEENKSERPEPQETDEDILLFTESPHATPTAPQLRAEAAEAEDSFLSMSNHISKDQQRH